MSITSDQQALIQGAFPALEVRTASINNEGLVNQIVVVNGERVFRFPRAEWAKEALQHEARVLRLMQARTLLALPAYDYESVEMASYPFVQGEIMTRNWLLRQSTADQETIAQQLAGFLQAMHTTPAHMLAEHAIRQSDTVRGREDWLKLYEQVQEHLFPYLMAHAREWVHELFGFVVADEAAMAHEPVLMHGDLSCYHLLRSADVPRLHAVLDFGTAGLGDPACDFGCVIYQYGESFLMRMSQYYPAIALGLDRARFWASTLELQWLLGGLRSARETIPEELRGRVDWSWFPVHIGMAAKDMRPIGSR